MVRATVITDWQLHQIYCTFVQFANMLRRKQVHLNLFANCTKLQ